MGDSYQEIQPPVAITPPTGHYASMVWIAGTASGISIPVTLTPSAGLNAVTLTIVPLGAGATYNLVTFDFNNSVLGFLNAMAFSDQPSASGGFMIQQSIDGINWDLNSAVTSVLANTGVGIKAAITVRFARVSYTNGATPQGTFRLGARATMA